MPKVCSAYGCSNRANREKNLHLFNFPLKNEVLLQAWLKAIRRENFTPSKYSQLCSAHFTKDNLKEPQDTKTGRVHLKKDAVPSIFEEFPHYLKEKRVKNGEKPYDRARRRIGNTDKKVAKNVQNQGTPCIQLESPLLNNDYKISGASIDFDTDIVKNGDESSDLITQKIQNLQNESDLITKNCSINCDSIEASTSVQKYESPKQKVLTIKTLAQQKIHSLIDDLKKSNLRIKCLQKEQTASQLKNKLLLKRLQNMKKLVRRKDVRIAKLELQICDLLTDGDNKLVLSKLKGVSKEIF